MIGVTSGTRTIRDALEETIARLARAEVPEPRADAELLVAAAVGVDRGLLVGRLRAALAPDAASRLEALVVRRARREPVFHLLGEREFWSLPIAVDRRVLTPRPETEVLVETALRLAPAATRVADVGTGSGCIAAALARERPGAVVVALDRDPDALAVAAANLRRHAPAVPLVCGDWLAAFRADAFDLVVANPPYVAADDLPGLAPEVRDHEPRAALVAGPDGLDALRRILADAPRVLRPGGWVVVEIGAGQILAVRCVVFADTRYDRVEYVRDPAGVERVVALRRRA